MNKAAAQFESRRSRRCWTRRRVLLAIFVGVIVAAGVVLWLSAGWRATREFQSAIANVDRIVVRDGGISSSADAEDEPVLFETTDPSEIGTLSRNLEFTGAGFPCNCGGFPRIDWYQGQERVALTAVQHGEAIRFEGADLCLSEKSRVSLMHWLVAHGVKEQEVAQGCDGPRQGLRLQAARMSQAQSSVARGEQHAAQGELDAAITDFSEAIKQDVNFARAYYLRGLARERKGLLDPAVEDFTSAIWFSRPITTEFRAKAAKYLSGPDVPVELEANLAPVYAVRGRAYEKKGEKAKAEEDFAQARKLESKPN